MKRMLTISALVFASTLSANALAGDRDAVVGAMVGGGAGALIGQSVNGHNGALIGGAIGALAGAAIASSGNTYQYGTTAVVYPQPVPVVERRVVVVPPRPVVVQRYEPPRRVMVVERRPGYARGWDRGYAYNDHRWH